jgi:GH18 family chitinase
MASKNIILLSFMFLFQHLQSSNAQSWIKAGYWYAGSDSPIPDLNSALFTHLICAFADINSSTYRLSIPSVDEQYFSSFTNIVKRKNPSVVTLLSTWNGQAATAQSILGEKVNASVLSLMLSRSSYRKSFIESSVKTARKYGFQGIDLFWLWPNTATDMTNMGILLDEWRAEVNSESRKAGQAQLILTMALRYLPTFEFGSYPIDSIQRNMDWAHVVAYDYHLPSKENFTHAHAALYDPSSHVNTDYGIKEWLAKGFPSNKLLLGLPYHGYAWALSNPKEDAIGAPSSGLAVTQDGSMSYKYIKWYIRSYGATIIFNSTYVMNYCVIGSTWINFDDVEAIRAKIAYVKEKKLLGYNVYQVINDDNWVLSLAGTIWTLYGYTLSS